MSLLLTLIVGLLLGCGVLTACGRGEPTAPPPRQIPPMPAGAGLELDGWKLSYPVPNDKGVPSKREPAATVAPWMVPARDGGMAFWAPAKGVTTAHSGHARTELQSLTSFRSGRERHTMWASVTVRQIPEQGRGIILGQIHGADLYSEVPYVMLRYQDGKVKVKVKQVQEGRNQENHTLLRDVPLNSRFDFALSDLGDGRMAFSATRDGRTSEVIVPVPSTFLRVTVRFQAGNYQQSDHPCGAHDGGRVDFHRLVQSTPPPPDGRAVPGPHVGLVGNPAGGTDPG